MQVKGFQSFYYAQAIHVVVYGEAPRLWDGKFFAEAKRRKGSMFERLIKGRKFVLGLDLKMYFAPTAHSASQQQQQQQATSTSGKRKKARMGEE